MAGEIARAAGPAVPEIVLIDLDPDLARSEPDPEIQALIRASEGLNLALDFLPGATTFDPVADRAGRGAGVRASSGSTRFVTNVDRTRAQPEHADVASARCGSSTTAPRSTSTTRAASYAARARDPFARIATTCCCRCATALAAGGRSPGRAPHAGACSPGIVALVPDAWLDRPTPRSPRRRRGAPPIVDYLHARLAAPRALCRGGATCRDPSTYDYAVIRVVPRVEREEFINVGVIVSCPARDFLEARIEFDAARVRALDPTLDLDAIRAHLATIPRDLRGRRRRRSHRPACRRASASAG